MLDITHWVKAQFMTISPNHSLSIVPKVSQKQEFNKLTEALELTVAISNKNRHTWYWYGM